MTASAIACVRHLVEEYRSFLKTSYRFLDPGLRQQFEGHLAQADVIVRGPFVTLSRDFLLGPTLEELVRRGEAEADLLRAHWPFGEKQLFAHQAQSMAVGRAGRSFVVTTGTGSGKTEAFLLPVIDGIVRRRREGGRGVQAVLLYPMNALANDQLERLRRLLRGTGLDISFALYTGDSDSSSQNLREEPAENERLSRAQIRRDPPDILLTNYKQLEFLLVRKEDRALFTPALRYLVLDELHSYRGALATEIACLIRRLKAHAGLDAGKLVGMGTSATVASGEDGSAALADFATVLFGETFRPDDVILERHGPPRDFDPAWLPAPSDLTGDELASLDLLNDQAIVRVAERLTGKACPPGGPIPSRVGAVLAGNRVVRAIEKAFAEPASIEDAVSVLRDEIPERREVSDDLLRLEVEAYLLVGSIGDDSAPPRLRPKLHTFFHGVYDVWLCVDPACRTLVPQGGGQCTKCGGAALPAALCRTCGQDFVKVIFADEEDTHPVGTGDFYSNVRTGFLTYEIHELPSDEEEESEPGEENPEGTTRGRRKGNEREDELESIRLCTRCVRVLDAETASCPECGKEAVPYLLFRGPMHTCPACGNVYTRGDTVTPLRTGTASTVSALATHHLDLLDGDDRKVLVFADNRQDVAHQAGYTADKHRQFALRHLISSAVEQSGERGVYLDELPEILFDEFRRVRIIPQNLSRPYRERWLFALRYEATNEFTRYTRQRASLENLGLVAVDYEFLEKLETDSRFVAAAHRAGVEPKLALPLVRVLLDVMRKNRAIGYDFFQEYIDPNRKRQYRELESEPYNVRFPDRDRSPKGFALDRPDHIRKSRSGSILGFFQENPKAGQPAAIQKVAIRVLGDRIRAKNFLSAVIPLLLDLKILASVPHFPIPARERTPALRVLQVNPQVIRLIAVSSGFRCNACQAWCAFSFPTCPTPRCKEGRLARSALDTSNYYVRLYRLRRPKRMAVAEHSAQVSAEDRAQRETDFKEGRLDALVCTPTLELGVDIGPLLTVLLRNAPPTPANYVQRVGRAGRRLRIGFVSTFCAGGAHDRHAFEDPLWLVSGRFHPPRVRLDNPRIVHRHLRSFALEELDAQLPAMMKEYLDDLETPTRWLPEKIAPLLAEVRDKTEKLSTRLSRLFAEDRARERTKRYGEQESSELVESFTNELTRILDGWWQRVKQLDDEYQRLARIGSSADDQRKAAARRRAYRELTQDPERAYALNYLSTQGFLPAYQFPVDTFSLDPGVQDTHTLFRPAAIAIEEFAPGNFVYANGHKLRSIRVLFAGGPGRSGGRSSPARSDAEASGRLQAFQFCEECDEATEAGLNACPRCGSPLGMAKDCVFVDSFEAEESLRIGSDEESRQRVFFQRREHLLANQTTECRLYSYPLAPIEHRRLAPLLVTNWGPIEKRGGPKGFWLCPDCGRHRPGDPLASEDEKRIKEWDDYHARFCSGTPANLILGYRYQSDCLVLSLAAPHDETERAGRRMSPTLTTLAESMALGASELLELEPGEVVAFARRSQTDSPIGEIVFYETVPGGAGYVDEMARRLPEVAEAARDRLYGHDCITACYLCLKHFRNQFLHPFLDKELVRDLLINLASIEPVEASPAVVGLGSRRLAEELPARQIEVQTTRRPPGTRGPQSPIEDLLLEALRRQLSNPEPVAQYEIHRDGHLFTVPDFAYPEEQIAIFCDGFAYHGNPNTLELDSRKRNWLQGEGWIVLTYWGRAIRRNPDLCAREITALVHARRRTNTP